MKRHNLKLSSSNTEIVGEVPMEAMWAEIHQKYTEVDEIPDGAMCKEDYSKKFSTQERPVSVDNARAMMDRLARKGILESRKLCVLVDGKRRVVRYYWPKKA